MIEFQPIDKVLREKKAAAFRQLKAAQGKASAVLGQLIRFAHAVHLLRRTSRA